MKVFGDIQSGNCYKIKLLLSFLDIPHEWVHTNILANETHTATFLAMNPNGEIPVLELDDGRYLCQSNAILNYLADGTPFLPSDAFSRAQVLQWQFFEQYSHEPYIAVARYIAKYLNLPEARRAEYESKHDGGYRALQVMENHLEGNLFFVSKHISIADISLYAYTHVAHEGGFDLTAYPNIKAWFYRVQTTNRYIDMVK